MNRKPSDKALFVGIIYNGCGNTRTGIHEAENHLDELQSLASTLGIENAGRIIISVKKINPAFLTGKGKVEEIIELAADKEADMIIFDEELSASQQRNWENRSGVRTIDRQELILAIFEQRATSKEAVVQVELAKYRYLLPRLKRAWTHLSRQRGGVSGTKGEGEKQIEIDRRIALDRIARLEKELSELKKHRDTARKKRLSTGVFTCAIAGYTNSGKSTLLNALTGSGTGGSNRLFDTLDPAARKLKLKGGREIILTDTVGFIRKLPHQLFEAFKSTLEEALTADMIIILLDASSPDVSGSYRVSMEVLNEIGADKKSRLVVFNKIDKCKSTADIDLFRRGNREAVMISASERINLGSLLYAIEKQVSSGSREINLFIPLRDFSLLQLIRRQGEVIRDRYTDDGIYVSALIPEKYIKPFYQYSISKPE